MNRNTFNEIVKKYLYLIYSKELNKTDIENFFFKINKIFKFKKSVKKKKRIVG